MLFCASFICHAYHFSLKVKKEGQIYELPKILAELYFVLTRYPNFNAPETVTWILRHTF